MGKNKHVSGKETDPIKLLFADDNPFRRKPQRDNPSSTSLSSSPPAAPPPKIKELGLGLQATDASQTTPDEKTRKIVDEKPLVSPPLLDKRKKNCEDDEASPVKRRRKRKREELETEYERKRLARDGNEDAEIKVPPVGSKRKVEDVAQEEMAAAVASTKEDAFDDESKLLRTVFVGNLPLKMKRKALIKEFARFGEVESVRIRSVPINGVGDKISKLGAIVKGRINTAVDSVHAYVVFKDEQSANAALSYNMTEVGGNHIRVDMACPPRKKMKGEAPLYDRKRTVFVGNLPFNVKDEDLYQLFCSIDQFGSSVEAVRVVRDPDTSIGKGIAFVLFKTRDAANSIVRRRDLMIGDRPIRLFHAKTEQNLPLKRKNPVPHQRDFPQKRSVTSSHEASSSGKSQKPKVKASSLSYQGLRASKSGAVKKAGLRCQSEGRQHEQKKAGDADTKVRKTKRPAVAARKAKLLKKRKSDGGTPENTHRNKKARR